MTSSVCAFQRGRESHCSYKLVTMMFKTHKIWFPPEFTLHLGNVPVLHSSLLSHSHKRFLNLLSMLVCLYLFAFPPSCTVSQISFQIKKCASLISPRLTVSLPQFLFNAPSCTSVQVPAGVCFICTGTHVLKSSFLQLSGADNIGTLISNKT